MNMINISVAGGVPSPVDGACGALTIGNVGDNGATCVALDFSAWAEEYGAGAVTLGVRRKGDAAWYPVSLTVTGAAAVWIVSNIDTAVYGIGEARFAYTVGEVEKRSAVFRFFVDRGLGAPEGTPPDPYEDWVERLEALGAETLQNAQDAAESAAEAQGYAEDAETAKNAAEAAQAAVEGLGVSAHETAAGSGPSVEKTVDPETGAVTLDFGLPAAPVTSVNGQTGEVNLDAEDVGALPGSSTLDDIPDGSTYKRATAAQLQQIGTNAADVQQLQRDVDAIEAVVPNQASAQNQLADKAFVNSSVQTSSAHFRGNWATWADVPTNAALYPVDDDGNTTPTSNDYMVLQDASGYPAGDDPLEGTWRFKFSGVWAVVGRAGWHPEYQVNETPLTAAQLAALNSGATSALIAQITANETAIQGKQATITASGMLKGDGQGGVSAATPGTDYATPEQVNAKYTKPASGIPESDLAQDVQTSLGKADTAIQPADYAPEAKTAAMTQAVGKDTSGKLWTEPGGGGNVTDVQVNGTSIVQGGVANVPKMTESILGVARVSSTYGTAMYDGRLQVICAPPSHYKSGDGEWRPVSPRYQHHAAFYGLAKAAGDTTQSASSNLVGQYTESAKSKISEMLTSPVPVTGSTPAITAQPGVRYVCGEVATLDITLPASGVIDVTFDSGSTPTVLTITPPTGVTLKWAHGFDPTSLDANTTYEINIMDGLGVAASWT